MDPICFLVLQPSRGWFCEHGDGNDLRGRHCHGRSDRRTSFDGESVDEEDTIRYRVEDSLGRVIQAEKTTFSSGGWPDTGPFVVPAGKYTVIVRGIGNHTGSYKFQIQAFENPNIEIALDQVVEGVNTFQGQESTYTFTLAEPEKISIDLIEVSGNQFNQSWKVTDDQGNTIVPGTLGPNDLGPFVLSPGKYTIQVVAKLSDFYTDHAIFVYRRTESETPD